MKPIYIAMGASFVLGVMGYIILMFWVRPILKYLKTKHGVAASCHTYQKMKADDTGDTEVRKWLSESAHNHRRYADALLSSLYEELPRWYIMLLDSRKNSPADAAKLLMALSNTHDVNHAARQIERIKQALL
jgi:hypothetical protein